MPSFPLHGMQSWLSLTLFWKFKAMILEGISLIANIYHPLQTIGFYLKVSTSPTVDNPTTGINRRSTAEGVLGVYVPVLFFKRIQVSYFCLCNLLIIIIKLESNEIRKIPVICVPFPKLKHIVMVHLQTDNSAKGFCSEIVLCSDVHRLSCGRERNLKLSCQT